MSKIGKLLIELPKGVTVEQVNDVVSVKSSKGEVKVDMLEGVSIEVSETRLYVKLNDDSDLNSYAKWGLIRALLNNAVIGVSEGFTRQLELVGVGYRVEKAGNDLRFAIGYSHPVIFKAPEGIVFEVEGNTIVRVSGYDKQQVGQVAANIREIRKPEPYKGKGIRYKDEIVKRKQGKTAKSAG